MIERIKNLSPYQIIYYIDKELESRNIQDHINFKYYKPHEKQLEFHATGLFAKERMLRGGNRIGKSFAVSREGAMHLTGIYPDDWNGYVYTKPINMWAGGVAERELLQLKEYYIGTLGKPGAIHPSLIVKQDLSQNLFYIQHVSGGVSRLRIKTYKQGEEAWQAETVDVIHLDEEPPPKIYSEAITRTASVSEDHHGMIMLSMTPLKGMTSLLLKFMERVIYDDKGIEIDTRRVASGEVHNQRVFIAATHDDAPHLSEETKQHLSSAYDPSERLARTTGVPSLGSGLIYPILEQKLVCDPFDIPDYWPRCFGMDFGWHNTAAIFAAHDQDNDVVYLYAEYKDGHLTPQHHAAHIMKLGANWMPGAYDYAGENAGQAYGENVVELYQKEGIRNWIRADKKVSEGIYKVLQRMESDKLKIFSTLRKTLAELRMYIRDDNGKVKKGDDHLMDSLRYLIMSSLPAARVKSTVADKYRILTPYESGGDWMRV
jgi:phage terminase large subunit-like protein